MTPIPQAIADVAKTLAELNAKKAAYEAEGLRFTFASDPAIKDVFMQVPVAHVVFPA